MDSTSESKLKSLLNTLVYGFALLGLALFLGWWKFGFSAGRDWPAEAITQLVAYVGIATLGVLICFTNVVFEKTSALVRVGAYGLAVYIGSLIYFRGAAINPLGDPTRLFYYTLWFATVLVIVCAGWYIHALITTNQYARHLEDYKRKHGGQES